MRPVGVAWFATARAEGGRAAGTPLGVAERLAYSPGALVGSPGAPRGETASGFNAALRAPKAALRLTGAEKGESASDDGSKAAGAEVKR